MLSSYIHLIESCRLGIQYRFSVIKFMENVKCNISFKYCSVLKLTGKTVFKVYM